MRKTFTQLISTMLLGMLVLLTPYGLRAQETQTTLETSVEDASACYNESNSYQVKVMVRDFVKIKALDLLLDYDAAVFDFEGATVNEPKLSGLTVTQTTDGTLRFQWTSGTPVNVSNNTTVNIVTLEFSIDNYPYNTLSDYTSDFQWDASSSYSYESGGDEVFTTQWTDGSLNVSVQPELQNIVFTPDVAACYNSYVDVTVEPDGYLYSFNGKSFTDNNVGNGAEGLNTVQLKDNNGCISLVNSFTIDAPDPVNFDIIKEDAVCNGGNGEIQFSNVSGGTPSYVYIAIPEAKIEEVAMDVLVGNSSKLATYSFNTNQLLRPAGTYYVAVQDANQCVDLFADLDIGSGWELVTIDEPAEIGASVSNTADVTCHSGDDGSVEVTMGTGGTPFSGGYYTVSLNNGTPVHVDAGATHTFQDLTAGSYTITVRDQSCTQTLTAQVTEPTGVAFSIEYDDVPCIESPNGKIRVKEVWALDGNQTPVADLTGYTFEVFGPNGTSVGTAAADGGEVSLLEPNYYSVVLTDASSCTYSYSNPDGSGNRVPIMSPELIQFEVVKTDVICKGSSTGSINVTNVSGAANYEYSIDNTNWQPETTFADLAAGSYSVYVRDADDMQACVISENVEIAEPNTELNLTVADVSAPSCDGGNDGNAFAFAGGGWAFKDGNGDPYYEYSLDGSPYWVTNPVFAVTEGAHTIEVRDSKGCTVSADFTVDNVEPIVIVPAANENPMECFGDKTTVQIAFTTESVDYADGAYTYYYAMSENMSNMQAFVPSQLATGSVSATEFAAGTYYFAVKDPNGCMSDATKLEITEGDELVLLDWSKQNATCASFWDGSITVEVTGGTEFDSSTRYKYAIKNNPDVFNNPSAVINWQNFTNDDPMNDSTVTIMTLKGTYYVAVADKCGQIVISDAITIEGNDPIDINDASIDIQAVTCYGDTDGYIDATGTVAGGSGTYYYTLYEGGTNDVVEGTEENQASGLFENLPAGTYWLEVTDDTEPVACPSVTATGLIIPTPDELMVAFDSLYVSCTGQEDGELTINITGGTGGTYGLNGSEALYGQDGKKYRVVINNTDPNGVSYGEYYLGDNVNGKTFQVAAGDYEVYVYDANGCSFGPKVVSIEEPVLWDVTITTSQPSDCDQTDGTIEVTVNDGGWDGMAVQYKLDDGSWQSSNIFSTVGFGTHKVYVQNDPADVAASTDPRIQTSECVYEETVTISEVSPFTYDVEIKDVSCHNGANGQFIITNVAGGTPGYQFQLVNSENPTVKADMWLPVDGYVTEFTFDTLKYGFHTLYIRDKAGYTLSACQAAESWEIAEPDSLEITQTKWLNDVTCPGGDDGSFEIMVTGGTPPYKYAATETHVVGTPTTEHPYINMPDVNDASLWQDDPVFNMEAGTFIAWVVDANGCWIGGEIRQNGQTIPNHRVVISEPDEITADVEKIIDVKCYGSEDGEIILNNVMGGNGAPFTYEVTGTRFDGEAVNYVFDGVYNGVTDTLDLVYASMDDTSSYVGPEDKYQVYAIDQSGCKKLVAEVVVDQPEEFMIDLVTEEDAFICAGDLAGILDIVTVSGGVSPFQYQLYRDSVLVRNWTANTSHIVQAGHSYQVVAKDANGCEASAEVTIQSPVKVTFTIQDLTCANADKASARVIAQGTPDRMFRVIYKELENDIHIDTDTTDWFGSSVDIRDAFVFDSENVNDVHYAIIVEDERGCKSVIDTVTFDASAVAELELVVNEGELSECTQDISLTVVGGTKPYTVMVNDDVLTDMSYTLPRGEHTIRVMDAHECEVTQTINVSGNYVTRDTTINTYIGEKTAFVDTEAGIDTMFAEGSYTFDYSYGENNCVRTLNVEVVAIPRSLTIAEVQGDGDESPWLGTIVEVKGTVTGVSEGEGFFMQDANAAWSGIWVAWNETGDLAIGDGITVQGEVNEIADVTTITPSDVTEGTADLTVEAVVLTSPLDVKAEMYESVVVQVPGARASAIDSTTGEWTIYYEPIESATVNDLLYASSPVEGDFYNVTGIVNARLDAFKLEPRMAEDVVDVTDTPADFIPAVEFNVYPNPFNDRINIKNADKLTRVIIRNIAGQSVIDVEYPSNEIRTANLVSGVYVVSMYTKNGIAKTERIVKR